MHILSAVTCDSRQAAQVELMAKEASAKKAEEEAALAAKRAAEQFRPEHADMILAVLHEHAPSLALPFRDLLKRNAIEIG